MNIDEAFQQFDIDTASLDGEALREKYLSKKGILRQLFAGMKDVAADKRSDYGARINDLKSRVEAQITILTTSVRQSVGAIIDITRPAYNSTEGTLHPIRRMLKDVTGIFEGMGFQIIDDREIETVEYCFDRLRTPDWHPARDNQDTFYVDGSTTRLLRTQTTATQPKILEKQKPPFRVISVGKVYRSDALDATHSPMFHQVDGFMVDEGINIGNLKAVLEAFVKQFIPTVKEVRFRPHYFGYTEPSLEMDVKCTLCGGKGCKACKQRGWIEILGAGMMHPELFENAGHDPEKYTGFAFGFGVERLVMQKYGVEDIRMLFNNDLRVLRQITR